MATGPEDGRSVPQSIPASSNRGAAQQNPAVGAVSPPSKRELASWWRKFSRRPEKDEEKARQSPGIFGVPLSDSIRYANVAISLTNEQGESFIYGYVPIVVAKCGVFLKEKATDVEGIFRLSGSAKRIKDLQAIFNSPERYGKGLDWTGYTVHDAANILRRYLNQLPEPIVPLDCYERFRDPLRALQSRRDNYREDLPADFTAVDHANAVGAYQKLITELPALNRQLLLYILDLLAVFASKSDLNRMPAANLAAIFQPGIISHPVHDMAPQEYRLSQDVLIFLIENQDNFLIGMHGTALDPETQKEVESGAPSMKSPKQNIGRSASTASAGTDSLRKFGVRRNVSTSSRGSRERTSPNVSSPGTPSTPSYVAGTGTGSLGRSNTVPSKRSPAIGSHRFQRPADSSIQNSPVATPTVEADVSMTSSSQKVTSKVQEPNDVPNPSTPVQQNISPPATSTAFPDLPVAKSVQPQTVDASQPLAAPQTTSSQQAPSRERKISSLFSKSPIFGPSPAQSLQQERQPRKLQKRQRIPGTMNESAQSSTTSLQNEDGFHTPLVSPGLASLSQLDPMASVGSPLLNSAGTLPHEHPQEHKLQTSLSPQDTQNVLAGLKPPRSPTTSLHSRGSMTDPSEFDALDDPSIRQEKRRNRWRFSSSAKRPEDLTLVPPPPISQIPGARTSNSSIGSYGRSRQSFTIEGHAPHQAATDSSSTGQPSLLGQSSYESYDAPKELSVESEKKGFIGKWKAKMQQSREERKEKEAERERAKSPQRLTGDHASSRNSLSAIAQEHVTPRTKSLDKPREETLPVVTEQPHVEQTPVQTEVVPPPAIVPVHTQAVQSPVTQPEASDSVHTQPQSNEAKPVQAQAMEAISEEKPTTETMQPPSETKPGHNV